MRDPARIDEMLDLLREIWTLDPDLRLGQLICNAARMRDLNLEDVFSIEDESLRKGLLRYLELVRSKGAQSDGTQI
jgi:uncharacterized protein YihD (DUF1040 family)